MKKLTRILLLTLCSNFIGTAVWAAEQRETAPVSLSAVKTPAFGTRMASKINSVAHVNLCDRVVLTPRLTKGGASVRLSLNF